MSKKNTYLHPHAAQKSSKIREGPANFCPMILGTAIAAALVARVVVQSYSQYARFATKRPSTAWTIASIGHTETVWGRRTLKPWGYV